MRLLIITQKVDSNDPILGFFHRWIEEFAKHCEQITVICLYEGTHNLPGNVCVFSLGKERGVSRLRYVLNFYHLVWRERKNYDAVFVHMNPIYVILGGLLWRVWKKKIGLWYTHKNVDLKLRIAEKLTDIIFTASRESFRLVSDKIKIVGHGIDTEVFSPVEKKEENKMSRVVTVGRISPAKDYQTLIEAVEILVSENVPILVDIIGNPATIADESYLGDLRALAQEKKLGGTIRFVGSVPNKELPAYLRQADLFVNMSHTGSLDKAVLEAMACGVLVATSNEAFADVFGMDPQMSLLSSGDAYALARRIRELNSLIKIKRDEVVKRFRDVIVEKHNIKSLIPCILSFYETSQ